MARAGVNFTDIKKAAEAINARGENPTVDRVREELGTGSKSTIAPLLKSWRAEFEQETDSITLPRELLKSVKALNDVMQLQAKEEIAEVTKSFELASDKLRQEITHQKSRIVELESDGHKYKDQAQESQVENTSLNTQLGDLQGSFEKKQLGLEIANEKNMSLTLSIKELKSENKDIRSHFEHYQESTAENQHQEREQFKQANTQLQSQLDQINRQFLLADQKSHSLLGINENLQSKLDETSSENKTLALDSADLLTQVQTVKADLQREKNIAESLNHDNEAIKHALSSIQDAYKQTEILLIKTNKEVEHLAKLLRQEENAKGLLNDQKNAALQEKAMIMGQFKQLQAALKS